ncbi:hypothetical protein ACQPZX_39455 [Actinoplanes sp. CA-142083]|uniref:hypothetical protein n=1 Tax=Actinoplanes sp. CA-142083 TaxID=3239903 RepID=UPI003D91C482
MSSEEKRSWILGSVAIASYSTYLLLLLLTDLSYAPILVAVVVGSIVVSILLHIAVTMRGPHEPKDERDREIAVFGDNIGQAFIVLGGVIALILALTQAGYFWIANALYLGFVLSAVFGTVAKVCAYRYGLPGRRAW